MKKCKECGGINWSDCYGAVLTVEEDDGEYLSDDEVMFMYSICNDCGHKNDDPKYKMEV